MDTPKRSEVSETSLETIRKQYFLPGGIEAIQDLTGLNPRQITHYARKYLGLTREIIRWGYVMKMPQAYLDKYESLKICEKCKEPILQGQEVRITKKGYGGRPQYVADHISCPYKKKEAA
jgi:hypothetical protein